MKYLNLPPEITQIEVELEFLDSFINQPEYMTCICCTPKRIMVTYHYYEVEHA